MMAGPDDVNNKAIDALALIERASLLLREASPTDLQRAVKVVIDKGLYEAMKFLLSNSELDSDKHFLLHQALAAQHEDIAKLLIESGADVNIFQYYSMQSKQFWRELDEEDFDKLLTVASYLPLQLSVFCSLDMTRFLLKSGADVNKMIERRDRSLLFAYRMLEDCEEFLLEIGAKDHVKNWVEKRNHHFVAHVAETIALLIEHGADVEADFSASGLVSICGNPHAVGCLKPLLEKGAHYYAINQGLEAGLHVAAKSGNSMALKLLLQYGAQLEARADDGDAALILACEEPVPAECVRILLENGAFPSVKNERESPLNLAKEARNEEKIEMLLQYGATEEDRVDQEETDLMQACGKFGNVRSVLCLLQNNVPPNVKNQRGETALHIAADTGDIETLRILVQYKADVNTMTDNGRTPLMLACGNSSVHPKYVKFLLDNKALPNVSDCMGITALHRAAFLGNIDKMKTLVHHGADVNARDVDCQTPLMYACARKSVNVKCIKFLLQNKASPNMTDRNGITAINTAISTEDIAKLKILLQYGADVNAKYNAEPPLITAWDESVFCNNYLIPSEDYDFPDKPMLNFETLSKTFSKLGRQGETKKDLRARTEIIKLLVTHGADLEARNYFDKTLFLIAAETKNNQLVELLYDLGADVGAEDCLGRNAILLTIEWHHINDESDHEKLQSMLALLIDKGVSINHKDKYGWTPLMLSIEYRDGESYSYLLQAGADVNIVRTEDTERGREETTALSLIWMEGPNYTFEFKEDLIRLGAVNSLPRCYNYFLHECVYWDRRSLLHLLITNGMAPTMCDGERFSLSGLVSPLTVAIDRASIQVIQYLLGNMILCPCDIYGHSYFTHLRGSFISRNYIQRYEDALAIMDEFYSQPKSLFQLSFVTVSHTLGGVSGRVDRINSLPLPSKVKNMLLFKSIHAPIESSE